jgi:hypothetical protein
MDPTNCDNRNNGEKNDKLSIKKAQKTLFGIKGQHITVKERTKIDKKSWKLMGKEYVKIYKNSMMVSDKVDIALLLIRRKSMGRIYGFYFSVTT